MTREEICPAYAGMIPIKAVPRLEAKHLSRVCGDDPGLNDLKAYQK